LDFSDLIIFSISLGAVYFSFVFEQGNLFFMKKMYGIVTI